MSVPHSEDHLRATHCTRLAQGEKEYNTAQYSLAAACFDDAKCALEAIAELSERENDVEKPGAVPHARLEDMINRVSVSGTQWRVLSSVLPQEESSFLYPDSGGRVGSTEESYL